MRLDVRVREALAAAHVDGDRLILGEQLDSTVYSKVKRALENAGGKWSRKSGAHVFPGGAATAIAPLLETGSVPDAKADHGAFYTPPALAAEVIIRAGIRPGAEVLEPSAGDGALARPAAAAGGQVTCIEIRPEACAALRGRGMAVQQADFLEQRREGLGLFDAVVMNPPFGRFQEVDHVRHALNFVRPGGRLVAIVPSGMLSREDRRTTALRDELFAQGASMEHLPAGSFRSVGTEVNAALVTVDLCRLPAFPR